ncbi:MAG: hypothetical protein FWG90_09840 [Oscillospiraceae bacterium]|nr:hypothetical protein [Oscillospiraceae bacterium]
MEKQLKYSKTPMELWLHFLAAETDEDLEKLESVNDKNINEAVAELRRLNADEEFKKAILEREAELGLT